MDGEQSFQLSSDITHFKQAFNSKSILGQRPKRTWPILFEKRSVRFLRLLFFPLRKLVHLLRYKCCSMNCTYLNVLVSM